MDTLKYKFMRKIDISEEQLFIVPWVTLKFNLLNTLKNI